MSDAAAVPAEGEKEKGARVKSKVLETMLDRLYASLLTGPGLNCRPHASRQRVDLSTLGKLKDGEGDGAGVLRRLLSAERKAKVTAKVAAPEKVEKKAVGESKEEKEAAAREEAVWREGERAWNEQSGVVQKLRSIAEDARTYEQDTGVHVLHIGFPLLSLPEGLGKRGRGSSRRILAPVALIPVTLAVRSGVAASVELGCRGEGVELVSPNEALLAWLEQHTGKKTPELFGDEKAEEPWREICGLVKHVAESLGQEAPAAFADGAGMAEGFALMAAPRGEDEAGARIVCSAVVGLFPTANEGLLRDTQAMMEGEAALGPAESFISIEAALVPPEAGAADVPEPEKPAHPRKRVFAEERLVAAADPCQARAVRLSRTARGLVIHGPPGTGKSQTITNIIGDHLARGQRVLMVCDKRTALDVVKHRLDAMGLGRLVAVVHDPQQDQKDLYMGIRAQLEELPDLRTQAAAEKQLAHLDEELQQIHGELTAYWDGVMLPKGDGASFHELIGRWMAIGSAAEVDEKLLGDVPLDAVRRHTRDLQEILGRGLGAEWARNPWVMAAGVTVAELLARAAKDVQFVAAHVAGLAAKTDVAVEPAMPEIEGEWLAAAARRRATAEKMAAVCGEADAAVMAYWTKKDKAGVTRGRQTMEEFAGHAELFRARRMDPELFAAVREALPAPGALAAKLGVLAEYRQATAKWTGIFAVGPKKRAKEVLQPFGVALTRESAGRVEEFLKALRARLLLRDMFEELMPGTGGAGTLLRDEEIERALSSHAKVLELLAWVEAEQAGLAKVVRGVLALPESAGAVAAALAASAKRAEAAAELAEAVGAAGLFDKMWWAARELELRGRGSVSGVFAGMVEKIETLESIVRCQAGLEQLPVGLRQVTVSLLGAGAEAEDGMGAIERAAIAVELSRRLRADTTLQGLDGQRLKTDFERYRALENQKRALVGQHILHQWTTRQKSRLLAMTGSRMSAAGADLKRRLTTRGERALRLRQVIAVGRGMAGGDPLFDMCPVWMASPETVAQLFERAALFDVVIFDEASQCRLEEALPVLTRAKRVVIAGDPKQLPPTRFFEAAVASSGDDEITGEQDLFEHQQAEVEDLLSAALNLQIEQSFLDVHYRSRNSDLIEFSNKQFYHSRLQAIPGHPDNKAVVSPLTLYRADGVYEDRCNEKEAERVCGIVRDLLRRAEPPSIGIACFNLQQRDLIVEKLDDLAAADGEFGGKLAAARSRKGGATFEGLFVKNLENVQGDERDHIIISTTYGPDKTGRFYQRFGPLGRVGGGRRLNVLVTRAREEVHLVTSIPAERYRSLPPVPAGQQPGGGWLLYSYLHYAETLGAFYAERNAAEEAARGGAGGALPRGELRVGAIKNALPSPFAEAMGGALTSRHGVSADVNWGNDGFCVDVALRHPIRADGVTIGVLCDGTRFTLAEDRVEWDVFRTGVLEGQGWILRRVWSPHFFRDAGKTMAEIVKQHVEQAGAGPRE